MRESIGGPSVSADGEGKGSAARAPLGCFGMPSRSLNASNLKGTPSQRSDFVVATTLPVSLRDGIRLTGMTDVSTMAAAVMRMQWTASFWMACLILSTECHKHSHTHRNP